MRPRWCWYMPQCLTALSGVLGLLALVLAWQGRLFPAVLGLVCGGLFLSLACWLDFMMVEETEHYRRRVRDDVLHLLAVSSTLHAVELRADPDAGWVLYDLTTQQMLPLEAGDVLLLATCPPPKEPAADLPALEGT